MIHSASFLATGSEIVASTWVASSGLCLRISSMTVSSASRSSLDVDEVAAIAAGATAFREEAGAFARWWREGDHGGGAGGEPGEAGAVCRAIEVVACAGVVTAVALRAIGRGFGSGILGLSGVCAACAESPSARTRIRLVAGIAGKLANRKRGRRGRVRTGVLCGESLTLQT